MHRIELGRESQSTTIVPRDNTRLSLTGSNSLEARRLESETQEPAADSSQCESESSAVTTKPLDRIQTKIKPVQKVLSLVSSSARTTR